MALLCRTHCLADTVGMAIDNVVHEPEVQICDAPATEKSGGAQKRRMSQFDSS